MREADLTSSASASPGSLLSPAPLNLLRASHAMICRHNALFTIFSLSVQSEQNLLQSACVVPSCKQIFLRGKGSLKPTPASERPVSTPFSLLNQANALVSVVSTQAIPIRFPRDDFDLPPHTPHPDETAGTPYYEICESESMPCA